MMKPKALLALPEGIALILSPIRHSQLPPFRFLPVKSHAFADSLAWQYASQSQALSTCTSSNAVAFLDFATIPHVHVSTTSSSSEDSFSIMTHFFKDFLNSMPSSHTASSSTS